MSRSDLPTPPRSEDLSARFPDERLSRVVNNTANLLFVIPVGLTAVYYFGPPEWNVWAGILCMAVLLPGLIVGFVYVFWSEKRRRARWLVQRQARRAEEEQRSREDRDRWSAEMAVLRAKSARLLAEAEAMLSEPIDPPPPAANPSDVLARLRDLDAHVTADVGPDGAVTVVLRPKSRPTASGAG